MVSSLEIIVFVHLMKISIQDQMNEMSLKIGVNASSSRRNYSLFLVFANVFQLPKRSREGYTFYLLEDTFLRLSKPLTSC